MMACSSEVVRLHELWPAIRKRRATIEEIGLDVTGQTGEYREIWMGALKADVYQRRLDEKKIRNIVSDPSPLLFGYFVVSQRANGDLYVVDGQHRLVAVRRLTAELEETRDVLLPCLVYTGLTPEQEASFFARLNTSRTGLKSVEVFVAKLHAKDSTAIAIKNAVEELGLKLHLGRGIRKAGSVSSVKLLSDIYERDGIDMLQEVLRLIITTWGPDNREAFSQRMIQGVYEFWRRYRFIVNRKRLVEQLSKMPISKVIAKANMVIEVMGGSPATAIGRAILAVYNDGLNKQKKLEDLFTNRGAKKAQAHQDAAAATVLRTGRSHDGHDA